MKTHICSSHFTEDNVLLGTKHLAVSTSFCRIAERKNLIEFFFFFVFSR